MTSLYSSLPEPVRKTGEYRVVKTPDALANHVLDGYSVECWKRLDYKWLVPVSKNGIFELGIYKRLMIGLASEIPDWEKRRAWIMKEMIWSFALTPACELITRRNFLCKVWNNMDFVGLEGNVQLRDFLVARVNKEGAIMIKKEANGKETYVKFDCVVGNPPYQEGNGTRNPPNIYHKFVRKAKELNPAYLSMVIPKKWMGNSGRGIGDFPIEMISSNKLRSIVFQQEDAAWFTDVEVKGSVCYFLWDRSYNSSIINVNGIDLDVNGEECIITDMIGLKIRDKVLSRHKSTFDAVVSGTLPFGIKTNHKEWLSDKAGGYLCHHLASFKPKTSYVAPEFVSKNIDLIFKYKVCTVKASGSGQDGLGRTFVVLPKQVVSGTYIVLCSFDTEREANNAMSFLTTKLVQYLISLRKNTQDVVSRVFKWVPQLDFSRAWIDDDLVIMFDLVPEEVAHIVNATKDFPMFRGKNGMKEKKMP